jgi:predicted acetyltransferase
MTVDYRLMHAEEVPAVIQFWSQSFDMPEAYQAARFASDPHACDHTYVAVFPDGTLASTLHYRLVQRYDATAQLRLVGEIDSVSTRPQARRQGHAQRLLHMALVDLERAGCDWSLLVSTEMGRPLYERNGWRCYPEPWRLVTMTTLPDSPMSYHVRPFDPLHEEAGWARLATVDLAYHHARPLTVVRDSDYWQRYAALRVGNWMIEEGLVIYAALRSADDPQLYGYAMAEFNPGAFFQIRDLSVLPSETTAISALISAVAHEAHKRTIPLVGRLFLPDEPATTTALAQLRGTTTIHRQNEGMLMARPIGSQFSDQDVDGLFAAPGAFLSCIDLF